MGKWETLSTDQQEAITQAFEICDQDHNTRQSYLVLPTSHIVMKATLLFILAALCVVVLADGPGCCAPKRWQGEVIGYSRRQNASFFEWVYYDAYMRRVRADVAETQYRPNQPRRISFTIIEKYTPDGQTFRTYTINPRTGACTYKEGGYFRELCVPPGYTHDWVFTIGEILKAHAYLFHEHNGEVIDVVVADGTCVPIRGVEMNHHGTVYRFDGVQNYMNIHEGIIDPFLFETPDDCKKAN
jgi:hypothetical protein